MAVELFGGTTLVRYHDHLATIAVVTERQADLLSGGYRGLVERGLEAALGEPVAIAVVGPDDEARARPPVDEIAPELEAEPLLHRDCSWSVAAG